MDDPMVTLVIQCVKALIKNIKPVMCPEPVCTVYKRELDRWDLTGEPKTVCSTKNAMVMIPELNNSILRPVRYHEEHDVILWQFRDQLDRLINYIRYNEPGTFSMFEKIPGTIEVWIYAVSKTELLIWLEHFKELFLAGTGTLVIQIQTGQGRSLDPVIKNFFAGSKTRHQWSYYFLTDPYEYGISFIPKLDRKIKM